MYTGEEIEFLLPIEPLYDASTDSRSPLILYYDLKEPTYYIAHTKGFPSFKDNYGILCVQEGFIITG